MKLKVILDPAFCLSCPVFSHSSAMPLVLCLPYRNVLFINISCTYGSLCPCPSIFAYANCYAWNVLSSQPQLSLAIHFQGLAQKPTSYDPFLMHPYHSLFWAEVNMLLSRDLALWTYFYCITYQTLLSQYDQLFIEIYLFPRLEFFEGRHSCFFRLYFQSMVSLTGIQ